MEDTSHSAEGSGQYRWRPAVSPYQPPRLRQPRPRRPVAGQMLLPGMEPAAPPGRAADPPASTGEESGPGLATVCPNCGGAEFDTEGDCTHCWEPGVAPAG